MDKTGVAPLKQAINKLMCNTALTDEARLDHFKNIAEECMREFMYEPNDEQTRRDVQVITTNVFTILLSKGYLNDFAAICDETINTPEMVDAQTLVMNVAVKLEEGDEFELIYTQVGPGDCQSWLTIIGGYETGNDS
jgi:hypothetical protein